MTVKELFAKWLMENENKQYLSDLSTCNDSDDTSHISGNSTTNIAKQPMRKHTLQIKPFYLRKRSEKSIKNEMKQISVEFRNILSKYEAEENGLNKKQFEIVTVNICGFSKYCNSLLFNKICSSSAEFVTLSMFITFWKKYFVENEDIAFRFIQLLKTKQSNDYLLRRDFIPLIKHILFVHPGLQFLRASTEFHHFYISTVICRIFYYLDSNKNNKICIRELRRSNFLDVLFLLDEEEDINEIFDYFSYEHFYVIYTKFWELDEDGDNLLRTTDLIKYGDFSLIPKVIDRIIIGSQNTNIQKERNKNVINYEEFVDFIISEEDKKSLISLKYWFRILDLDCDGILSPYELETFFEQQSAKILKICDETVKFDNILVLLNDMISPKVNFKFTMRDIKKSKMGHLFFDTLININKFALSEQRDVELINEIRNSPHMTDWDRFASKEYFLLSHS